MRLPVSGPLASPSSVRTAALTAEELGFDSLWVHDFIVWTHLLDRTHVSCGAIELITEDTPPLMLESLTTLAFVAAATERIRIGTAILCVPFRNPVIAAKQAATIDVLSDGRLILGVGVGGTRQTNNQDFEVLGVSRTTKYQQTRDYVQAMRVLWEEPYPKYEGEFVQFPETEMNPKPVQDPLPLWFGGKGDKSLDLAADFGNGWLPTWMAPDQYTEYLPKLLARLEERGRARSNFVIAKEVYTCIASTTAEAEELAGATMETFSSGFTVQNAMAAWESSLIGDPEQIIKQIQSFLDVGVEHFEMKFIYRSIDELVAQLELFGSEVISAFRDSYH